MVKKTELGTVLDGTEKFAALLAALGHDLNHRKLRIIFPFLKQIKVDIIMHMKQNFRQKQLWFILILQSLKACMPHC